MVKSIRVTSLLIGNSWNFKKDVCENGNLFFTNQPINSSDLLRSRYSFSPYYLKCKILKTLLTDLQQLSIEQMKITNKTDWVNFENTINKFEKLTHLHINKLTTNKDRVLRLNNVRILTIINYTGKTLRISAPNLTKICCFTGLIDLFFTYSNRIRHLITGGYCESINQYSNLERLELREYNFAKLENIIDIFTDFNRLKELHMRLTTKENVNRLVKQKKIAKNVLLSLYFNDFKIDGPNDARQLFGKASHLKRINSKTLFKNYDKLANVITFIDEIDYGKLMSNFDNSPPVDFHSRWVNIRQVSIKGVKNCQVRFVEFIRRCKILNHLFITNTGFDGQFYDDLNVFCRYITKLRIEDDQELVDSLDINFVFKLKYIEEFAINRQIDCFDLIEKIFKMDRLEKLCVLLNGRKIELDYISCGSLKIANNFVNSKDKIECLNALEEIFKLAD